MARSFWQCDHVWMNVAVHQDSPELHLCMAATIGFLNERARNCFVSGRINSGAWSASRSAYFRWRIGTVSSARTVRSPKHRHSAERARALYVSIVWRRLVGLGCREWASDFVDAWLRCSDAPYTHQLGSLPLRGTWRYRTDAPVDDEVVDAIGT